MPGWLEWLTPEWSGVIVALMVGVGSILYARKQSGNAKNATEIAAKAKMEAKRSADAAEAQVEIARQAAEEARRSAEAALQAVKMDARREHLIGAVKDIELTELELRHDERLNRYGVVATFTNRGQRTYTYTAQLVHQHNSYSSLSGGTLRPGENVDIHLGLEGVQYQGVRMFCNGECPCEKPDSDSGHWELFFPRREPTDRRVYAFSV